MKITSGTLPTIALLVFAAAGQETVPDERIEAKVRYAMTIEDNPRFARSELNYALHLAADDTNRFTRILQRMSAVSTNDFAFFIQEIGRYGNATNLPFLYACVTNSPHADCAVMAVCRIGGVTWELTNVVATAFEQTNMSHEVSENICLMLLGSPPIMGRPLTNAEKGRSIPCVISQAKRENIHVDWIDRALRATDPSYAYSRRRLEVMRSVLAAGPCASRYSYVTNVIHELTSCPETDLSD